MNYLKKHQKGVDRLATRLLASGKYKWVRTNEEYHRGEYHGEIDVHAKTLRGNYRFCEYKCTDSARNFKKATDQYKRYKRAFPKHNSKGIYVTSTCIERMVGDA